MRYLSDVKRSQEPGGYLRIRLVLQSQDIVEVFVYLVDIGNEVHLQDYSLHWQHSDGALVQRWDTSPHHSELANFPSHTHRAIGEVEPAATLNWHDFLALLQREILEKDRVDPATS